MIVSGGDDRTIRIWDLELGRQVGETIIQGPAISAKCSATRSTPARASSRLSARATARNRLRWMPSMSTLGSSSFTPGRRDHGLDQFIGMVLDDKAQTVLADLGAGSTKETY